MSLTVYVHPTRHSANSSSTKAKRVAIASAYPGAKKNVVKNEDIAHFMFNQNVKPHKTSLLLYDNIGVYEQIADKTTRRH